MFGTEWCSSGQDEVRRAGRQWIEERYNTKTATAALIEGIDKARAQSGGATTATHPAAWMAEIVKHFPHRPQPVAAG
ncbi:hypothetical protein [Kutzneria sp. CA-103260]|uniref:hypothetical protein n=1 Tax=Kutzneria sp. CA-103260 TaxID=2802641 RepID=UPI001BAD64FF|nr:hypothetical protein [Kutzneria sp. CA-103260]QUQ67576.1 hypothetical protein JJ691_53110 [Kutzneria sp. CA-103260]